MSRIRRLSALVAGGAAALALSVAPVGGAGANATANAAWTPHNTPLAHPAALAAASTVAAAGNLYVINPPERILDTRTYGTGPLGPNTYGTLCVGGSVVPTGTTAIAINLTATGTQDQGYLATWPDGTTWGGTSNINWSAAGQTVANMVLASLGSDGCVNIGHGGNGTVDVVVDLDGYYHP